VADAHSVQVAERIAEFLKSDGWTVIKYRLNVAFKDALQHKVNANVRMGDMNKALLHNGMMLGVEDSIGITERVTKELTDGKLVADVALSVIENKQRNKEMGYGK